MKRINLVFGSVLICVVFLSGCLNISPEALAMANPLVKQFMEQYPNAKITVTHFTAEQSGQILENISAECGNPYMTAKEYYRINIDDPDSGLKVIAWVDWETKNIECAVKYGGGLNKTISKPGEPIKDCKSHAETKCYGEHVYWFDACGHKEEKKQYCENGCELGFCKEKENCTSNYEYKCHDDHVYWYDSCGNKEEKKEYCLNGCEDRACNPPSNQTTECTDSDGGKNYYEKGTATKGTQSLSDHCNDDGTLTEKYCEDNEIKAESVSCPQGYTCSDGGCVANNATNCTSHYEYKCYSGHVYWYDSCGNKQEKREYCNYGCENGNCKSCTSHYEYKCYSGDVYWFDSCGNVQDKKEYCNYGCENGACLQNTTNTTNNTWSYKRKITITSTKGNIEDYPIVIRNFDCGSHCKPDGSDIRVANADPNSFIDFGLVKTGDTTFDIAFKVNLPENGIVDNIYVYYGNPQATGADKTWEKIRYNVYDDFGGSSVDSAVWSSGIHPNGGTITVSGGVVKLISGEGYNRGAWIKSGKLFNLSKYNVYMETKVKSVFNEIYGNAQVYGLHKGYETSTGIFFFKLHDGSPGCGPNMDDYNHYKFFITYNWTGGCFDYETIEANFTEYQTHLFNFTKNSGHVKLVEDGDSADITSTLGFENLGAFFYATNSDRTYDKELWVDYVKLYVYLDEEPSYVVGPEE